MNEPVVIGAFNPSVTYTERPTVKALILNEQNEVLIINNGLLPGGGIETGEDDETALRREIVEEVGMNVSDLDVLGVVSQFRNLLGKQYIIRAYSACFVDDTALIAPQDEGEAQFTYGWYTINEAKELVDVSIKSMELIEPKDDDSYQGKLYNLQTTMVFLDLLEKGRTQV